MWYSGNYTELKLTKAQAMIGYHSGECIGDIRDLMTVPRIKRQLAKLNPESVRKELAGYGAWSDTELANHTDNLERILWIACGDIVEASV